MFSFFRRFGSLVLTTSVFFLSTNLVFAVVNFSGGQLVKNITAGDDAQGSGETVARHGDQLRHLFFLANNDSIAQKFIIKFELPDFLSMEQADFEIWRENKWQKFSLPKEIQLAPHETVYLRFTTLVTNMPVKEDTILTVLAKVKSSDQTVEKIFSTKVYLPNFTISDEVDRQTVLDKFDLVKDQVVPTSVEPLSSNVDDFPAGLLSTIVMVSVFLVFVSFFFYYAKITKNTEK